MHWVSKKQGIVQCHGSQNTELTIPLLLIRNSVLSTAINSTQSSYEKFICSKNWKAQRNLPALERIELGIQKCLLISAVHHRFTLLPLLSVEFHQMRESDQQQCHIPVLLAKQHLLKKYDCLFPVTLKDNLRWSLTVPAASNPHLTLCWNGMPQNSQIDSSYLNFGRKNVLWGQGRPKERAEDKSRIEKNIE